jgi:DNA ligase (NAD+)
MRDNREIVERLFGQLSIDIVIKDQGLGIREDSLISGKSFCVTGSFESMSRDEIHELIEKHGGEIRSSVSSKLHYLIAGESAGSKLAKANECGVQVLSLDEFLRKTA